MNHIVYVLAKMVSPGKLYYYLLDKAKILFICLVSCYNRIQLYKPPYSSTKYLMVDSTIIMPLASA